MTTLRNARNTRINRLTAAAIVGVVVLPLAMMGGCETVDAALDKMDAANARANRVNGSIRDASNTTKQTQADIEDFGKDDFTAGTAN